MTEKPTGGPLAQIAGALTIQEDELASIAVGLFSDWISGRRRFPTLSQQNQEWYRTVLDAAGKVNPTREDLKSWFGLPHGTAQYLATVFYDPEADRADESTKAEIATQAVAAISRAADQNELGSQEATFYLSPRMAKSLEALLIATLADAPKAPPTITRLAGAVSVKFSANSGLEALCEALGGDHGDQIRQAAGA